MYSCVSVYADTSNMSACMHHPSIHPYIHTYIHTYIQTDRQTDRQTDTDTQTADRHGKNNSRCAVPQLCRVYTPQRFLRHYYRIVFAGEERSNDNHLCIPERCKTQIVTSNKNKLNQTRRTVRYACLFHLLQMMLSP